jgi:hypothetical protein
MNTLVASDTACRRQLITMFPCRRRTSCALPSTAYYTTLLGETRYKKHFAPGSVGTVVVFRISATGEIPPSARKGSSQLFENKVQGNVGKSSCLCEKKKQTLIICPRKHFFWRCFLKTPWSSFARRGFFVGRGVGFQGPPGRPFSSRTASLIASGPKTGHPRSAFRPSGPRRYL